MAKKGKRRESGKASPESKASPDAPPHAVAVQPEPAADASALAETQERPQTRVGLSNSIIAIALLYQVAMPLRYYLGGGGADERFSWRMFSTVRMQKCTVQVDEQVDENGALQQRPVDLTQAFQIAWMGMLERNRPQVVDKVLKRRCEGKQVRQAHYSRSCVDTDGATLPTLEVTLDCARGELIKQAPTP
jgi:hypothetical protein